MNNSVFNHEPEDGIQDISDDAMEFNSSKSKPTKAPKLPAMKMNQPLFEPV